MEFNFQILDKPLSGRIVDALASQLENDQERIDKLLEIAFSSGERRVVANSFWILNHLSMSSINTYLSHIRNDMIDFVMNQTLIRHGLVLSLINESIDELNEDEFRVDFLDFCFQNILNPSFNCSCRSLMIKIAYKMVRPFPELRSELRIIIDSLPPGQQASIESVKRKIIRLL